jgi:4-amino-4-deoxy-L-arabinose transferase-like glycosyltransferase
MRTVILFVELLRVQPSAVFWAGALTQTALWWLVPAIFYAAPPDGLAITLAVGRQFRFGTEFGPPLGYWLAEIVYAGLGFVGVYLVAQICVLVAYWAVFTFGRAIVGARHAAIAVLLMAGVFAFTMPTAELGPGTLALPLWALALLHYWRAVGEGRQRYWLALGVDLALLVLTTYSGQVLLGLLLAFTVATPTGRERLMTVEPWLGGVIAMVLLFPWLTWLDLNGGIAFASLAAIEQNLNAWLWLIAMLAACHAGLLILIVIGCGLPRWRRDAPVIERAPVDALARRFILVLALAPAIFAAALALFGSGARSFVAAPLVLLTALAAVALAPARLRIAQQRVAAWVWAAVLLVPPIAVAAALALSPWLYPTELKLAQPAAEIGRVFAANFQGRTGRPLAVVAGDARLAALIALAAPSRPTLYLDATPELTPWVTPNEIAKSGALVVWPAGETRLPPAAIRERFPGLTAEAPQVVARAGRLPPLRIGWAIIPPRSQ